MRNLKRIVVAAALAGAALGLGPAPSRADGWGHGGWGHGGWGHGGGSHVAVSIGVAPGYWWGGPGYYRPYGYYGYYGRPYPYYGYYGGPPVVYAPPPVVYGPPVVVQSPPVYIQRPSAEDATGEDSAPPSAYWYYCASKRQYYPKVKTCRERWLKVVPDER